MHQGDQEVQEQQRLYQHVRHLAFQVGGVGFGCGVWGVGLVPGLGCVAWAWGFRFGVWGLGFGVWCLLFVVWGWGLGVGGLWFGVLGLGFGVLG